MILYRAVSHAEHQDLKATGRFRPGPNAAFGKWFAETEADARRWGAALEGLFGMAHRVVSVRVPDSLGETFFRVPELDNVGTGVFIRIEDLRHARPLLEQGE